MKLKLLAVLGVLGTVVTACQSEDPPVSPQLENAQVAPPSPRSAPSDSPSSEPRSFSEESDARAISLLEAEIAQPVSPSHSTLRLGELAILKRYRFLTRAGRDEFARSLRSHCSPDLGRMTEEQGHLLKTVFWNQFAPKFDSEDSEFQSLIEELLSPECRSHPLQKDVQIAAKSMGLLVPSLEDCTISESPNESAYKNQAQVTVCSQAIESAWSASETKSSDQRIEALRVFENAIDSPSALARVTANLATSPMMLQLKQSILPGNPSPESEPYLPQAGKNGIYQWSMRSQVTAGPDAPMTFNAPLPERSGAFSQSRNQNHRGGSSKSSYASVSVISKRAGHAGKNHFFADLTVDSGVRGGYEPPQGWNSALKHGTNFTSKVSYQIRNSLLIPSCRTELDCQPLLQVRVQAQTPEGASVKVKVLTQNQGEIRSVTGADTFVIDRMNGDHVISIQLERYAEHAGGCCTSGNQRQVFSLEAAPVEGTSTLTKPLLGTPLQNSLAVRVSQWRQERSRDLDDHQKLLIARDFGAVLMSWTRARIDQGDVDQGRDVLTFRMALSLMEDAMEELNLRGSERDYLQFVLSESYGMLLRKLKLQTRVQVEGALSSSVEKGTETLDQLIEQWIHTEEMPSSPYLSYQRVRRAHPDGMKEMDELVNSLLENRDKRILLLADLMDYRDSEARTQKENALQKSALLILQGGAEGEAR